MFKPSQLPIYDPTLLDKQKAEEALAKTLRQLQLRATCPQTRNLNINRATAEELHAKLTTIHGIGPISVNKIITSRDLFGDFLSARDFDRRIKGLTFARVEHLCGLENLRLTFAASSRGIGRAWGESYGGVDRSEGREGSLGIATWNTGRMSRRGRYYESKMGHLVRFVGECEPDVMLLQEVCRGVAKDVRKRLTKGDRGLWEMFEGGGGDSSLAVLYRADRVVVEDVDRGGLNDLLQGYMRMPQMGLVREVGSGAGAVLVVVNLHLGQKDPREEIELLGEVVRMLKGTGSVMLAGDFNMNSDAKAFDKVREGGMVEIVRPDGKGMNHPFCVLNSRTTVGGEWFDNFWVEENRRRTIVEAFSFEFGGVGKRLRQSGHEFAAETRSRCSDHLPVVIRVRVT